MTVINRSALVPYSARQMFELVDGVEAYPEFLPWCSGVTVHERSEDELCATIEISKAGIHKAFTTRNRNQPYKMIEMRLVEGPFRHLEGFWRFDELGETACKVSLDIEFEFSSRLLSMSLGPVFSQICNTLVEAFVQRARQIY